MGECDTILPNVGERLVPLNPKIAGALKTQLSNVALHKHSVVRTTYGTVSYTHLLVLMICATAAFVWFTFLA